MSAVRMRRTLDVKGADAVMAAAEDEAVRNGYRVVIAVVDAWGHLLQLRRTDGAQAASGQVAIDKARTAARTGAPPPCTWPRRCRCKAASRSSTAVR
jgi:glc operon protein GlcG